MKLFHRNKTKPLDDILQECLERLARGESVEECTTRYPAQAAELRPLLRTAVTIREASSLRPRPEFKVQARTLFREALYIRENRRSRPVLHWRLAWTVSAAVVCFLVLSTVGTSVVAADTMPDHPLYPLKLVSEQARVALAPSPIKKAEVYVELASKRVVEIEYVARKGDTVKIVIVAEKLNIHLDNAATLAAQHRGNGAQIGTSRPVPAPPQTRPSPATPREQLGWAIQDNAAAARARLQMAMEKAPPKVQPVLAKVIEDAQTKYDNALKSVERKPSNRR